MERNINVIEDLDGSKIVVMVLICRMNLVGQIIPKN